MASHKESPWPFRVFLAIGAVGAAMVGRAFAAGYDTDEIAPPPSPEFVQKVRELVTALDFAGIKVKVGPLTRSLAAEQRAYDSGRSAINPWKSKHLVSKAVDVYPIDPSTGEPDYQGRRLELFKRMVDVAKRLGWKSLAFNADGSVRYLTSKSGARFWDGAHLERP